MDYSSTTWPILGTNFQVLSFILAALLIVVDVAIYYPFLKVYDEQILEEERSGKANDELKEKVAANFNTAKADAILEKAGVEAASKHNHRRNKCSRSLCWWRYKWSPCKRSKQSSCRVQGSCESSSWWLWSSP